MYLLAGICKKTQECFRERRGSLRLVPGQKVGEGAAVRTAGMGAVHGIQHQCHDGFKGVLGLGWHKVGIAAGHSVIPKWMASGLKADSGEGVQDNHDEDQNSDDTDQDQWAT